MRKLLLLNCTKAKKQCIRPVPALELYNGRAFRAIRGMRDGSLWPYSVDVKILSSKYGLINQNTQIELYDQELTPERAGEICAEACKALDLSMEGAQYQEVFVNMTPEYYRVLDESQELDKVRLSVAPGNSEERMARMVRWLMEIRAEEVIARLN